MFKRTKLGSTGGGSVVKNPPSNCRGHRFYPWSRKIPHAARHSAREPQLLKPGHLCKRRNHCSEKPLLRNWTVASRPCDYQRLLSNEDPAQPLKKYTDKIYMPVHVLLLCWKMMCHVCLDGRPLSRCYHLNVVLRLHVQCQKRQPLFLRSRTRKRKEL